MKRIQTLFIPFSCCLFFFACNKNETIVPPSLVHSQSDTLILNPSGNAPLTALQKYSTRLSLKSKIVVKGRTANDADYVIENKEPTKTHQINILGLYPNHDNLVIIEYLDQNENVVESQNLLISTDSLPIDFPEITVIVNNSSQREPGWDLVSYWGNGVPQSPFISDERGNIRWYLDFSENPELTSLRYDNGIERLKNGNFYFGDINSNKIYEVDIFGSIKNSWGLGNHLFHHNVQEKENGNFLVTTSKTGSTHLNGSETIEDYAIEIDRQSGLIIREWDLKQSLDENRTVFSGLFGNPVDWFHGNAIIENKTGGILISGRTQGYVSIDNANQIEWVLSTHQDWDTNRRGESLAPFLLKPLNSSGQPILDTMVLNGYQNDSHFSWPWYGHAPFYLPNGNLMVFDNGDNRNFGNSSNYSRAVEYEIDESNKTIKQIWEYGRQRGTETFGQYVSDVDYLPHTGNILFSPGFGTDNNGNIGGRIVEIDYQTKSVVYEVLITPPGGVFVTFHRTERIFIN